MLWYSVPHIWTNNGAFRWCGCPQTQAISSPSRRAVQPVGDAGNPAQHKPWPSGSVAHGVATRSLSFERVIPARDSPMHWQRSDGGSARRGAGGRVCPRRLYIATYVPCAPLLSRSLALSLPLPLRAPLSFASHSCSRHALAMVTWVAVLHSDAVPSLKCSTHSAGTRSRCFLGGTEPCMANENLTCSTGLCGPRCVDNIKPMRSVLPLRPSTKATTRL